jgi:Cu+-exporting ATPase
VTAVRDLIENVEDVGFEASLSKEKAGLDLFRKLTEIEYYRRSFFVALFFMVIFVILMGLEHIPLVKLAFNHSLINGFSVLMLVEWLLASPVNFWVGRKIHMGCFAALRHKSFTMDVLLSVGCNASYFYSVFVSFIAM